MAFAIDCNGLTITQAAHVHVYSQAPERCIVSRGDVPHPPLWLDATRTWGVLDDGVTEPAEDGGVEAGADLFTTWRVTVMDRGDGITIESGVPVDLVLRWDHTYPMESRSWAGPADYNVDGQVDSLDTVHFFDAWLTGRADFNCDGSVDAMDLSLFLEVWDDAN